MNEFLQQFLIESRELVEQGTAELALLEKSPEDQQQIDAVFRAFHTLKGGAAIVEFPAMERAVHAAESALGQARSGRRSLTTPVLKNCVACLDQIVRWLDAIERSGELPRKPDDEANRIVEDFKDAGVGLTTASEMEPASVEQWANDVFARNPGLRGDGMTAVRFKPDTDSFFKGEDPLATLLSLPGLLAFDVEPARAWPALSALDPYSCNLVVSAIARASSESVRVLLQGLSGVCELRALTPEAPAQDGTLPPRARDILNAQVALLNEQQLRNLAGCIASAGRTSANVLRSVGEDSAAEVIARATEASLKEPSVRHLLDALSTVLAVAPPDAVSPDLATTGAVTRMLRVDAEKIDALVRLTGELTVARNSLGHLARLASAEGNSLAAALKDSHGVFDRLLNELQRSVLAVRVLPLRTVFQRIPRMVREISTSLGKTVTLEISGEETEADKTIVELLFEPLLHIVRNAVDHGVESPAERAARGKPPIATIRLRGSREGDRVLIEVSDDGAGIDPERIREKARKRGMASDATLAAMSEQEIIELVFAAGFSTATQVTELSGRGVGLDVVRTAVERVGGRVFISSRVGSGTSVRFSLPFGVMMTQVITVEASGQMFGVPLEGVVETVRVPREAISGVGTARATVMRDRTIPVIELATLVSARDSPPIETDAVIVVVVVGGQHLGLEVDGVNERMEVMLKPLEGLLAETPGLAGTTFLGDGRVLLVLNLAEMLQ